MQLTKSLVPPYDIYIKEKAVLGRAHVQAFGELGIQLGEDVRLPVPDTLIQVIEDVGLPDGISMSEEDDKVALVLAADMEKKLVQAWLKETNPPKTLKDFIINSLKMAKSRKPTGEEVERGRDYMCQRFYDVRTFGAVMSLKSAPNCGQVRGPVQMTFARSINQVVSLEHSITRMAVATEAEAEKQQGDNRTMGRKFTIPYGLYNCHGFVSAPLAAQTGFSDADLELLWDALKNMFDHDRSAARGEMTTRKLIVFKHESQYGNAPAHRLFDRVKVSLADGVTAPRSFSDYDVKIDDKLAPDFVIIPAAE